MQFTNSDVVGAVIIDPDPREDERGRFSRSWCSHEFAEHGLDFIPVQANMVFSHFKGTVRGMHFQIAPAWEAKLVRCTRGTAFDVVLDVRPESASFRKWIGVEISAENGRMVYVPAGCAHGCQSLEDATEIYYFASCFYAPACARGVRFDDPAFNIAWPLPAVHLSKQDRGWPLAEKQLLPFDDLHKVPA